MITISFGSIELSYDGVRYWLYQENGEGMEVSEVELEKLLQDYYKDKF